MATAASLVHKVAKNGEQKWEPTKATQVGCIDFLAEDNKRESCS
jgi:hypothetical protein